MPTANKVDDIQRECAHHGLTNFKFEISKRVNGGYRCRKCVVENVTKKRRALKRKLVEQLGGSCSSCGYDRCMEALHFHHRDGKEKDGLISRMIGSYQSKAVYKEVVKCDLLCANCHAEAHSQTMA